VVVGITIVGLDSLVVHRGLLTEAPPSAAPEYLLRAVLAAISAVALVAGLTALSTGNELLSTAAGSSSHRWQLLAAPGLALASAVLLLTSPSTFTNFALEDHLVEYSTVLFLLAASVLLVAAIRRSDQRLSDHRAALLLPSGIALTMFLIAGEEISWGQRIFSVPTPGSFGANDQAELNLHNFATSRVENAYYFGAFIFLILGPVIGAALKQLPEVLTPYVPSPRTAIGSAVAFGFAYDMWDISLTQISFFGALAVLALWAPRVTAPSTRPLIVLAGFVTIMVQASLFINGHAMERIYDATEYRELFIPIGFYIYASGVWREVNQPVMRSDGRPHRD